MANYRHNTNTQLGGQLLINEVERESTPTAHVITDFIDKETVKVIGNPISALPANNNDYTGQVKTENSVPKTPENIAENPNRLEDNQQTKQGISSGLDRPTNNNFGGRQVITPDYAVLVNGKDTEQKQYIADFSNSSNNENDNKTPNDVSDFQDTVYNYTTYLEMKDHPLLDFEDTPFRFTDKVEKMNTKQSDFF